MKTLVFLTAILGLVDGRVAVELAVPAGTAEVEVLVDGDVRARLEEPPWTASVDLGGELAPRRLQAVARDGEGRTLDRAEQWLNVPRGAAEVKLSVEALPGKGRQETEPARIARLSWTAVHADQPVSVAVTFDGAPLPVDDPAAIPLPPQAADGLHVLSAQVTFADGTSSRTDLALGDGFGEAVESELTAVAVELPEALGREWRSPGPSAFEGWLSADGRPVAVRAVEGGGADLYFVLDRGAAPHLDALGKAFARRLRAGVAPGVDPGPVDLYRVLAPTSDPSRLRSTGLEPEDRLVLVRPTSRHGAGHHELFPRAQLTGPEDSGTAWRLGHLRFPADGDRVQRLADAVAVAGVGAAASGRPRAVVLVVGPDAEDGSQLDAVQVRRYLGRLGVPLSTWYVHADGVPVAGKPGRGRRGAGDGDHGVGEDGPGEDGGVGERGGRSRKRHRPARRETARLRDAGLAEARERWGPEVRPIADLTSWLEAHRELRSAVGAQRILWVEGSHFPGEVDLATAAPPGVALVGGGDG